MGGTSGPLYTVFFLRLASKLAEEKKSGKDYQDSKVWAAALQVFIFVTQEFLFIDRLSSITDDFIGRSQRDNGFGRWEEGRLHDARRADSRDRCHTSSC